MRYPVPHFQMKPRLRKSWETLFKCCATVQWFSDAFRDKKNAKEIYYLTAKSSSVFMMYFYRVHLRWRKLGIVTLWLCHKIMERSTIINWKTHYRIAVFNSYVTLLVGKCWDLLQGRKALLQSFGMGLLTFTSQDSQVFQELFSTTGWC